MTGAEDNKFQFHQLCACNDCKKKKDQGKGMSFKILTEEYYHCISHPSDYGLFCLSKIEVSVKNYTLEKHMRTVPLMFRNPVYKSEGLGKIKD